MEPFEKLLELISFFIFDTELKPDNLDILVSFDEVILLELQCITSSNDTNISKLSGFSSVSNITT